MKARSSAIVAALVLVTGLGVAPASAQGLLGNLLGGGGGGGVADVKSGTAGNSALVNAGIGGDSTSPNNIADVNIGGGGSLLGGNGPLAKVSVTGGNGQGGLLNNGGVLGTGLLDSDDDGGVLGSGILGSNLAAGIDLGGLSLDLDVPGIDDLLGGGGSGGSGGNGGNGAVGPGGGVRVGSLDGSVVVNCSLDDGRKVLQIASQAKLNPSAWARAANVQVVPIRLCPQARAQVAQIFNASGKIRQLQRAAAGDALIVASLSRSRYDISDVFAIDASGGRLMVYVY